MINCVECLDYAKKILDRGEIEVDDLNKLAIDRHILKGCESGSTVSPFDINEMTTSQLKDMLKMVIRLMNCEHDRLTSLQDRVLKLEYAALPKEG